MKNTKYMDSAQYIGGVLAFVVLLNIEDGIPFLGIPASRYLSIIFLLFFAFKIRGKVEEAYKAHGIPWLFFTVLFFALFMVIGFTVAEILNRVGMDMMGGGMLYSAVLVVISVAFLERRTRVINQAEYTTAERKQIYRELGVILISLISFFGAWGMNIAVAYNNSGTVKNLFATVVYLLIWIFILRKAVTYNSYHLIKYNLIFWSVNFAILLGMTISTLFFDNGVIVSILFLGLTLFYPQWIGIGILVGHHMIPQLIITTLIVLIMLIITRTYYRNIKRTYEGEVNKI